MRKTLIFVLAAMMLAAVATGAFAAHSGDETGQGKNNPCDEPPPDFCPDPVDPTADDNGAQALRVAVAIGDEGQENSVGRVGVAASEEDGLQVYGEDYTEGDVIANTVEDLDRVTGCALFAPDPEEDQDCAAESDDDTALITLHPGTTHAGPPGDKDCTDRCAEELEVARTATEKYRNVAVALADGYIPTSGCVTAEDEGGDPDEGVMGIHFTDVEKDGNDYADQILDVREPEMLLYVPDAMVPGGLRLVAIEYSAPALVNNQEWRGPTPPPEDVDPAPELFDHVFDGPMRGHDPLELQAWHYDLLVWAWSDNPSGTFAHFNPREDCDPTTSPASAVA